MPVNGVPISRPLARVDLFSRAQQRAPAPRLAGLAATRTLAMPFGFSMGEVVVTLGVVAVAFGPKDIPVIARGLGAWRAKPSVRAPLARRVRETPRDAPSLSASSRAIP